MNELWQEVRFGPRMFVVGCGLRVNSWLPA